MLLPSFCLNTGLAEPLTRFKARAENCWTNNHVLDSQFGPNVSTDPSFSILHLRMLSIFIETILTNTDI